MAAKKQVWTVRVVNWDRPDKTDKLADVIRGSNHFPGLWLEQLRYMGIARELKSFDDRNVIEFDCPDPRGIDTKIWAEQNAARMQSFGIDAAAAPKWQTFDGSRDDRSEQPHAANTADYMERLNFPGPRSRE